MHWPTQGQWWSNLWTQLLHIEQWEVRGGRYSKHVSQNFTFTVWPLTITSLVRGSFRWGVVPLIHSMEGVGISNASSNSGGFEFLGTIPGSLPEVNRRNIKSCTWVVWHISFNFQNKKEALIIRYKEIIKLKKIKDQSIMIMKLKCHYVYSELDRKC